MLKPSSLLYSAAILIAVAAVLILGTGVVRKLRLDDSSQEFALDITPRILTEGAEVQLTHSHSTFLQEQADAAVSKYLYVVTRVLGELTLLESVTGGANVPLLIFSDMAPTANYEIDVLFSGGPAKVNIELIYEMEKWLILGFEVESDMISD